MVCFICGAPHSGSTLLGLILGSHSQCFYAGEANKVRFLHREDTHKDSMCKVCGRNCPIWSDFYLDPETDLYEQLSVITHKPIIIDSTKKPSWLQTQIKNVGDKGVKSCLVYLFRDGRAVINSRLRKYKDSDPQEVIDRWMNHLKQTNSFFREFPREKIKIHYKELAVRPKQTIKALVKVLGIDFELEMIDFFKYEHHPLGGNTGTQSLIVKAQKDKQYSAPIELTERNKYYYERHPLQIKYDQRWKEELDPKVLSLFNEKAREFNEELLNDRLP
jgi:hypothetical protein